MEYVLIEETCEECKGSRSVSCHHCLGEGKVHSGYDDPDPNIAFEICFHCNGSGIERCPRCRGSGKTRKSDTDYSEDPEDYEE
jgi:DnaJ-class molecular chaperone